MTPPEFDAAAVEHLRGELGGPDPVLIPHLPADVHDLDGLVAICGYVFA